MPGSSSHADARWGILPPAVAYGLLGLALASLMPSTPGVSEPSPAIRAPCTPVASTVSASAGRLDGDDVALFTNGSVALRVCEPGTLTMRARGTASGGHAAHLVVAGPSGTWFDDEVARPSEIRVEVREPGWIVAAFVNDASDGEEDRNLWLDDLTFVPGR